MTDEAKTRVERPGDALERAPSEPGLPERYIAGDEIARGGMGRVLDATDTLLERKVAVKEALSIDSDVLRRFQRETKITARLEHPSIVPVYDAGRSRDGTPFYVMRRVSGRPLDQLIRDADDLNDRLALLPKLLAATQAIAHAHSRGVIHRDLKPSNILVGDLGETVVIDWGLAKVIGEPDDDDPHALPVPDPNSSLRTRVGTVFGTPGFMSPEQLEAKEVDERSDVYALGATLYYLLARQPPHSAASEDEMMSAALAGPATPISNVIQGVPAELSTICDKALAYDDDARYADASALAADLDRFLRGQLVAAHDYSIADRLVRFVRQNRVAVGVAAAAVVALAVGGVVATRNILAARDDAQAAAQRAEHERADAVASRERETERANEVTLAKARLLLDSNPGAALATVQPLARTAKWWRQVRAIAADARNGGIAHRLAASDRTVSITISPDGRHGLAAGADGVVRMYDLATRAARTITELHEEVTVRFLDDSHAVAIPDRPALVVIDLASTATREVVLPATIHELDAHAGTAWWADREGHAWALRPNATSPEPIAVADEIRFLRVAPDGAHVALGGKKRLWSLTTGGNLDNLFAGPIFGIAWGDPNRLAVQAGDGVYDVTLAPPRAVQVSRSVTEFGVAIQRGVVYSAGLNGITVDGERPPGWDSGKYASVQPCGDDVIVTGTEGFLSVLAGRRRQDLQSPFGELMMIAASPRSHFVLTVNRWQLYLWNLDELLPRTVAANLGRSMQLGSIGAHSILVTYPTSPARWIDLETGAITPGPVLPFGTHMDDSPSGRRVLLYPFAGGVAVIAKPGTEERSALAEDIQLAVFLDDDHVLGAMADGSLRVLDIETRAAATVSTHPTAAHALRISGRTREWIALGYHDGVLWRMKRSTRAIETHTETGRDWQNRDLAVTSSGDVWFVDGAKLRRWRTDGTIVDHATVPTPIAGIVALDDHRVLAYTRLAETFLIDLDTGALTPSLIVHDSNFDLADDAELIAIQRQTGGVLVIDTRANEAWRLARFLGSGDTPHISHDGRFVFARTDEQVSIWTLDLPTDAHSTGAWVDALADAPAAH